MSLLEEISSTLEAAGIRHALIGALALAAPRERRPAPGRPAGPASPGSPSSGVAPGGFLDDHWAAAFVRRHATQANFRVLRGRVATEEAADLA
jgi:hypothetical protein